MVRIGIIDKEIEYVSKLCAYLNRYGKGLWNVSAYTDEDMLYKCIVDKHIDMLAATDHKTLQKIREHFSNKCYVWLTDDRGHRMEDAKGQNTYTIYRYQSARLIGDALRDIIDYLGMIVSNSKMAAVIYSPIGRCGKTTIAMKYVREVSRGRWLYIGMEDYSGGVLNECDISLSEKNDMKNTGDDFLYFMKDRNEEAVNSILMGAEGIITSPFSLFDSRLLDSSDIEWFLKVFEKSAGYQGVIFDMGTGILQDINVLAEFKSVIVPFLNDSISLAKRKQFENLITAYELEELTEKIIYLDMSEGLPLGEFSKIFE